jgi:NAD(P)-dependent dehydrogenase (short-subunit alcohol dehydrogenase family)
MDDYSHIFDLIGRRAFVIGGASGIGRAGCFGLASFGAQVICGDVAVEQAKATAQEITAGGSAAEALHIDLCDGKSVASAAAKVGTPDVLVISPSINVRKPVLDYTEDEFDRVVGLNLKGIFRALKAFVPGMVKRGKGSVIVFSSIRAQVVEPGQGIYAATKAGTVQMIRALAAEIGRSGVRANAIAPGVVETPLTQQIKQNDAWYRLCRQVGHAPLAAVGACRRGRLSRIGRQLLCHRLIFSGRRRLDGGGWPLHPAAAGGECGAGRLERDPEKWVPVSEKITVHRRSRAR